MMKDYIAQLTYSSEWGNEVEKMDVFKAASVDNARARVIKNWDDKLMHVKKNGNRNVSLYQSRYENGYGKGILGYVAYWKGGRAPENGVFIWTTFDKKTLKRTDRILNRDGSLGRRL